MPPFIGNVNHDHLDRLETLPKMLTSSPYESYEQIVRFNMVNGGGIINFKGHEFF